MRPQVTKLGRMAVAAAAGLTATVGLAALAPTTATAATTTTLNKNFAGVNRYDTSAKLAEAKATVLGGAASNVVLATGADFPDALAGNYLAGQQKGVILLTPTSTSDTSYATYTVPALTALKAKTITILGGVNAVGSDVQADLTSKGYTVSRIGGATRYDTAQMVDTQAGLTPGNGSTGGVTGILATGVKFPDALSAGPLAYKQHFPIVLTDGSQATLSPQAVQTIATDKITHLIVMGGDAAIPPAAVTAAGGTVDKQFKGVDRTDTAAQLLDYEIATYGFPSNKVFLASGLTFPDALSSGPLGGDPEGIVLTEPDLSLGTFSTAELTKLAPGTIDVLGGNVAVPDATAAAAQTAAQGGTAGGCNGTPATNLPQLCGATIVSTTLPTQANSTNAQGTVVEYLFTKAVTGGAFTATGFKVYDAADSVPGGLQGGGVCGTSATCPAATNPNAVRILFPALNSAASAAALTLATVVSGAVTLTNGQLSPDGDAAINGGGTSLTFAAGVTSAPDLLSFGTPRPAATPTMSAIDLTFDKAFVPATVGSGTNATKFDIVFTSAAAGGGSVEFACTSPDATNPNNTVNSTSPGFQSAAKIMTITCTNPSGVASGAAVPAGSIAWIVAQPGAVTSADSNAVTNQFIEATSTPAHGDVSPDPRLTGISYVVGTASASTPDQAVFTFDKPVTGSSVQTSHFSLFNSGGGNVPSAAVACGTAAVTTAPGCQVTSAASTTSVDLFFPHGTLAGGVSGPIVGGTVSAGGVANASNGLAFNPDDEFGALPSGLTPSTQTAGSIAAPQLSSATITPGTNGLGQATITVAYKFDTSVAASVPAKFHAYDADGTSLTCVAPATVGTGTSDTTVTCTSYIQTVGGSPATATQLSGIVLVTVDNGAVTGNTAGSVPAPSPATFNPEGAAV